MGRAQLVALCGLVGSYRSQYTIRDPAWPLWNTSYLCRPVARIHLNDFGPCRHWHAVMRQPPEHASDRGRQRCEADLRNLLPTANDIANAGLRAEHALERRIDVAVTRMAVDLARLATTDFWRFFSGRGLAIQTCTLSHTLDACQSRRLGCWAWTPASVPRAAGIALPG